MDINIWAVLVSAVASMVIGSVWYGPLFGPMFMEAMDMKKWTEGEREAMKKQMMATYLTQFIASIVMFYVLAKFIVDLDQMTVTGGLVTAFWAWLGFVVPVKLGDAIWGGKMTLFWIGIGNMLVTLLAAGAIIGAWN